MAKIETTQQKYINALCKMHEDNFTKEILKPLFESMGYERVDFNGGPNEKGKDLIAFKSNPPQKDPMVTFIQSKKIGNAQKLTDSEKHTKILHQLWTCCTDGVITTRGEKVFPSYVYLACPEQMSNRFIEGLKSHLEKKEISCLDGPEIINLIKQHKPDLLDLLIGVEDKLSIDSELISMNRELFSALKIDACPCFDDYYSDLSFFVGSFDSNTLLNMELDFISDKILIAEDNWIKFKKSSHKISLKHNLILLKHDIETIENNFNTLKTSYESKKNQSLISDLSELRIAIENNKRSIQSRINFLVADIKKHKTTKCENEIANQKEVISRLQEAADEKKYYDLDHIFGNYSFHGKYKKNIAEIFDMILEKRKLIAEKNDTKSQIINKPFYSVEINTIDLKYLMDEYKKSYIEGVTLINQNKFNRFEIKQFLIKVEKSLSLISDLTKPENQFAEIIKTENKSDTNDRVSISPHEIFKAGHDIALYGGAGVGKTTTLQAYAKKHLQDKNGKLIYIPLNRRIDIIKKMIDQHEFSLPKSDDDKSTENNQKELLIKVILLNYDIEITEENLVEIKSLMLQGVTVILDGLDEVYSSIPSITDAISEFKENYPDIQLIVSSRDCVSYLEKIDFLGITLLPFTEDQLKRFIGGWLKDSNKASELINSIDKRKLYNHIKTPLLATITCSLVERGINAPSSETEIYIERLRLLTGEYDAYKNINRQTQKSSLLMRCAIKLAFKMHEIEERSVSKEKMYELLQISLGESHSTSLLNKCLEELINPCNILIKDPITSKYSFGHFRFQEHLASEELKTNRGIDLTTLLTKDWWRGVFCLYAQENNFEHLIDDLYKKYNSIEFGKLTLLAMIEHSNGKNKSSLSEIIRGYEKADYLDDITTPYDVDYYDHTDIYSLF